MIVGCLFGMKMFYMCKPINTSHFEVKEFPIQGGVKGIHTSFKKGGTTVKVRQQIFYIVGPIETLFFTIPSASNS